MSSKLPVNNFMGFNVVPIVENHGFSHRESENNIGEPFPDMENAFPHLGEIFPQMENSFPHLGEPFPDMENAFPHLGEIFPQMENAFPHLGELIPHLENPFPNIVRTINRIVWEKKHVNSLTSKKQKGENHGKNVIC